MKRSSFSTKMALFLTLFVVFGTVMMQAQNPTDVNGYETVSVSIPASSYDASAGAPQMAPVKYNKQFPLVITSDDMGKTELTNNWAEINGYPNLNDGVNIGIQPGGTAFLQAPLKKYYTQGQSQDADDYAPMTYTDNVGKTQRYRMTSAIMPYELANNSYDKINANDAKLMLRTGFSFAQHDVEDISSVANITAKLKTNSDKWAQKVGIGLKVMVEPNGNHDYLAAAQASDEMCWSIFQNNTSEYPFNSLALADWTHSRSNWATVSTEAPTNFNTKPTGGYQRTFFQGHESEWQSEVNSADGTKILIGGTHGIGSDIRDYLKNTVQPADKAWVAAADEVWEYYHIYNNVKIENVIWNDGTKTLSFDVQVPTYKKNQFRELTLNIPGLSGATACTTSGATVYTGGWKQSSTEGVGFTMNLGMENSITSYIDQLMTIYRDDQNNAFVKRDLEYLIAQLWDGTTKSAYTTQLEAAPAHTYNIVANTGETLYTGRTDANETRQHAVPRYILNGTTLYETEPNASTPKYVKSVSTTEATTTVQYTAKDLSSLAVTGTPEAVLFVEGEDLDDVAVVGADYDFNTTSAGRYWAMVTSSGAMGGSVISGKPVTITSALPRGKYKMVIGYGEAYKNQGTYTYTVNAGGSQIYSFSNTSAANQAVTEFTSGEFIIETGGTDITISSNFSPEMPEQSSRWIDYVYFVKTGSPDPTVTLTSSKTSPMAGTNVILTAKATPGSSNNTVTYLAIEQEVNGVWTSVGDPYSAPSASRGAGIRRVASQDPTTGEVTVTYLFPAGSDGTSYNFRANATISDGVNTPTTVLSTDAASAGGQGQTLQLTAVENTATTYKYHLLNANGTEVAYCENTVFGLPANMISPLVTNIEVWSDAAKTIKYTSNTGMVFGSDYYVTYDLTTAGQELFAGGKYKIYTTLQNGKYVNKASGSNDAVGAWSNGSNDIWRISGDPYSLQISMADDPTKKISFANYINGSQCTASASNTYNTFIILASDDSYNPYILRLNEGEAYYEQDVFSVVDNGNPLTLWRKDFKNDNGYLQKRFRFDKQNIYTYHIIDAGGNDVLQSETNSSTLSIPANINSPWCTLKSFSTLANAQAYTASGDDSDELVGSTLSVNEVYIGYQVKSEYQKYFDIMSPQYFTLKINNTQMYSQSSNNGAYNSGTGTNNKYWYMTGDPYNVRLYNEQKKAVGPLSFNTMPTSGSADMSFGSGTYQTFAILNATNTSPSTLWAFRASGSGITTQEAYINLNEKRLKVWRTTERTSGGNAITLTETTATYTYNIVDCSGRIAIKTTVQQSMSMSFNGYNSIPEAIRSPYISDETITFYSFTGDFDAANLTDANKITATPEQNANIYVTYTTNNYNDHLLKLRAARAFNMKVNGEYVYDSGSNGSGTLAHEATDANLASRSRLWYFDGGANHDPYAVEVRNVGTGNLFNHTVATPALSLGTTGATSRFILMQYGSTAATGGTEDDKIRIELMAATGSDVSTAYYSVGRADGDASLYSNVTYQHGAANLKLLLNVGQLTFTYKIIDKQGKIVVEQNTQDSELGLPSQWTSPMVSQYHYWQADNFTVSDNTYTLKTSQTKISQTYDAPDNVIYVTYDVITDENDANYVDFNTAITDYTARVDRSASDKTQVRDANLFGTMYRLKFLNGVEDYLEKSDEPQTTLKKPVYPYANGDGQLFVYDADEWTVQSSGATSTRTRWTWYLLSPNNDPYHVMVTSWQQSHTDKDVTPNVNYYNYFRTYYNTTINQLVTTTISDDPKATNTSITGGSAANVPTQYMILGTSGHYKLVTSDAVSDATADATYGTHQQVKTFENYWKNNPTVQGIVNAQDPAADNATLTSDYGWHRYGAWANAADWGSDSKTKTYTSTDHWYKTFDMGDGTFDLEETEIDAALVLLDNHGWEVMRQPIAKYKETEKYAAAKAALKKFDSPMVKKYKFYASKAVDHKVTGYHKYNIENGAEKALKASDRVESNTTFTSLADYPEAYDGGSLKDLYVTYDVKEDYANSYTGAATEGATSASQFVLRQGTKYAKADDTTINAQTSYDASDITYKWYLKPNFNIDDEMGYGYDVGINGRTDDAKILTKAETNEEYQNYNRQGFDPYNLRIQNVSTETYFTTNATTATLDGGEWTGNGSALSLTAATATPITPTGYDNKQLNVTNATFIAVQDANGNLRLMPRFDASHVVQEFNTLTTQAAAQTAGDQSHSQTTLFAVPVTYHVVDNSGNVALTTTTTDAISFGLPRKFQSPFAENYTYHSSLENASGANRGVSSDITGKPVEVWVGYTVKSDFAEAGKPWTLWNSNGVYLHPVINKTGSGRIGWWYMTNQGKDCAGGQAVSATTLPFLDNSFAWTFGTTPDPYNAKFHNKAAKLSMRSYMSGNNWYQDYLVADDNAAVFPYCLLYSSSDEANNSIVLFDRTHERYPRYDTSNQRWVFSETSNTSSNIDAMTMESLPQIDINVVNSEGKVELTLDGYYKSGCTTWSNPFTPYYLHRYATSGHTFYYTLADAVAATSAISGSVNDATVAENNAVYVKYTIDNAKWNTLNTDDNTTIVKSSPGTEEDLEYLYWYGINSKASTSCYFKAQATTSSPLIYTDAITGETDDAKLAQWALMGTPYALKVVNRYYGVDKPMGCSTTAKEGDKLYVYDSGSQGVTTTFEVIDGLGNTAYLYLRPQGSMSGKCEMVYIGNDNTDKVLQVNEYLKYFSLNYVDKTVSQSVTFKLYGPDNNPMSLNETALTAEVVGVANGDNWTTLFNSTDLPRQYCTYTFYTDATFATTTTADDGTGYISNKKDIYVKWNYTADAPVFSSGTDASKYQYYVFANRAAIDGYNTYNDGGVTTKLAAGKYNPDNKTQIGYDQYVDKENSQWALVGNPYDFALYNRVGKYLRLADGATIANNQPVGFTETVSGALSWCLPLVDWTDENQALSDRVNREADAFRLFYPKINGYNVGLGNTQLNAGSDNIQWGFKRIEYIVVPLTVYDGSMTVKDEQEYSVPYPETDGHVINGDKLIRGTYHKPNLKHGFCDYTYYNTYTTGTPATLSGKMPAGGFDACGGTEQKKKEVYATYTVDEEMFLQPWLTYNITDGTKQHYSRINDSHVQESMQTEAATARQDTSKRYQWVFKGDPYNFQIANVSMGETETTALYPLGAKETGWEISENRYLHVTNNTETYHYNTFEIVEAEQAGDDGSGKYSITLIHSGIDRYKGGIVYPKDGMMQMREDAYADTWLTPVVEQYNIVWQVIDASGSDVLSKTVKNQYDGKVIRPSDMPEELKRHFCEYTFYYAADNAAYSGTTPALADAGVAIHSESTIYAKYTLDSGAPEFMSAEPASSSDVDNKYWHEIHYPSADRLIMRGASTTNVTFDNLNDSRTIADVRNDGTNYPKYCWALIGTPYGVKFYNRDAQQYLTIDGTTLSLSATGTTFDLMDDVTGDLCDIFDRTTETYVTSQATVSPEAYRFPSYQNTSAEFTNTDGLVKITFVLHYSDKTLRQKDSDNNGTLDADAKNTTQDIVITTFQKKGKALANVLPTMWKRAFCDYTYHWNNSNRHDEMANDAVTNINDDMVAVYNNGTTDIYVHVTYDFKTTAPFKWSSTTTDRNGKYWYYMVNNHYQAGEQGRMVRRGSSPTLLVNTGLKEENKYLSYFEWCVIGDPYGFKMLNRYDPDQRYDQYISVTNENDESNAGKLIEQQAGNGNCIFEMMPGQYNYNFWMHPIYTSALKDETSDEMSYVGHNYNGSAAIIPTTKATVKTLTTNSAANFRLEIQTTESLADYVKYAGFVGGLKYDKTTSELRAAATAGTLSAEQKAEIRTLIDNPEENIVLMKQGYYRMVPLNKETTTAHTYVRGYLDEREKTASGGFNKKLKMEDQTSAESDPASIFWFEGTTVHDNDANKDFPRYYVRTQGLNLSDNSLTDEEGYKTCYEDLGGAMMQLKVKNEDANPYTYLNCSKTSTEISLDRCFGHPWSDFNTSFYLQPVGTGGGEMPLKANLGKGHNGSPTLNQSLSNLPYTYKSFCVPYDLQVVGGHDKDGNPLTADQCDMMPFIGLVEHHHTTKSETSDTYYNADEYALYCESIDEHQRVDDWKNSNLYIPAGTPVILRSCSGMTDVTFVIPTDAPSTATAANQLTENCLKGNYIKKSDTNEQIRLFGKESVIHEGNWVYTGRVGLFARANPEMMLPSNSLYYVEPVRGSSASASSAQASNTRTMLAFGRIGNYLVTLNDAQANTATIEQNNEHKADITLSGRKLYKDGDWNTICLPFTLEDGDDSDDISFSGTVIEGATVMELDTDGDHNGYQTGYDSEAGTLYLFFKTAETIEAGKAYLIKWETGDNDDVEVLQSPTFNDVVITGSAQTTVTASNSGLNTVQFVGNYDPVTLTAGDKTKFYLGSNNQLYWPKTDVTLNAFRGYFVVDLGNDVNGVRAYSLGFGDEETTGVALMDNGELIIDSKAGAWYDLGGRKLNGKPTQKGVYIYNGKKRVVK